ncbi:hypothetical protein IQ227_09645 [Anabaena aphanizomenioides LEGE 00250]|uniref:Uncharacterized protein n=1 Tax=Sphaerospermopsis aphanizomenoides LEGE 00250 TaxID=2777972 RepID=A0ABR9VCT5_9CYAN|nr:hypothetical protein [Sphaerospermopsis aphanizomenoides]MBE9236288.1 hypothetical protein [Sphaerospermopsis aphanizomenoides LEGE 00250]
MWLKPINRFNATKVAIDLSPCLKAWGLHLVSGSLVIIYYLLFISYFYPVTNHQSPITNHQSPFIWKNE